MSYKSLLPTIRSAFEAIDTGSLIRFGESFRKAGEDNNEESDIQIDWDVTTEADNQTQKRIVKYFNIKELEGTFAIMGEEFQKVNPNASWNLLIDPIDGTASFVNGGEWGILIGAADLEGNLIYSMLISSSGRCYFADCRQDPSKNFDTVSQPMRMDIFNYEMDIPEDFVKTLENDFRNIEISKNVAASISYSMLLEDELDSLVWLPSESGKKIYPYYDLIGLGVLRAAGFFVITAGDKSGVRCVIVARSTDAAERLYGIVIDTFPNYDLSRSTDPLKLKILL
jgi:hypothetical protein